MCMWLDINGARLMNLEGKVALRINKNFRDQITQVQAPGQGSNWQKT